MIARAQTDLDKKTQRWCDALSELIGKDAVSTQIPAALFYSQKNDARFSRFTVAEQRAEVVAALLRRHGLDPHKF